jgi:hypothetical protein
MTDADREVVEEATRSVTAVSFALDKLSVEQLTRVLRRMRLCADDFEDTRPADDA